MASPSHSRSNKALSTAEHPLDQDQVFASTAIETSQHSTFLRKRFTRPASGGLYSSTNFTFARAPGFRSAIGHPKLDGVELKKSAVIDQYDHQTFAISMLGETATKNTAWLKQAIDHEASRAAASAVDTGVSNATRLSNGHIQDLGEPRAVVNYSDDSDTEGNNNQSAFSQGVHFSQAPEPITSIVRSVKRPSGVDEAVSSTKHPASNSEKGDSPISSNIEALNEGSKVRPMNVSSPNDRDVLQNIVAIQRSAENDIIANKKNVSMKRQLQDLMWQSHQTNYSQKLEMLDVVTEEQSCGGSTSKSNSRLKMREQTSVEESDRFEKSKRSTDPHSIHEISRSVSPQCQSIRQAGQKSYRSLVHDISKPVGTCLDSMGRDPAPTHFRSRVPSSLSQVVLNPDMFEKSSLIAFCTLKNQEAHEIHSKLEKQLCENEELREEVIRLSNEGASHRLANDALKERLLAKHGQLCHHISQMSNEIDALRESLSSYKKSLDDARHDLALCRVEMGCIREYTTRMDAMTRDDTRISHNRTNAYLDSIVSELRTTSQDAGSRSLYEYRKLSSANTLTWGILSNLRTELADVKATLQEVRFPSGGAARSVAVPDPNSLDLSQYNTVTRKEAHNPNTDCRARLSITSISSSSTPEILFPSRNGHEQNQDNAEVICRNGSVEFSAQAQDGRAEKLRGESTAPNGGLIETSITCMSTDKKYADLAKADKSLGDVGVIQVERPEMVKLYESTGQSQHQASNVTDTDEGSYTSQADTPVSFPKPQNGYDLEISEAQPKIFSQCQLNRSLSAKDDQTVAGDQNVVRSDADMNPSLKTAKKCEDVGQQHATPTKPALSLEIIDKSLSPVSNIAELFPPQSSLVTISSRPRSVSSQKFNHEGRASNGAESYPVNLQLASKRKVDKTFEKPFAKRHTSGIEEKARSSRISSLRKSTQSQRQGSPGERNSGERFRKQFSDSY